MCYFENNCEYRICFHFVATIPGLDIVVSACSVLERLDSAENVLNGMLFGASLWLFITLKNIILVWEQDHLLNRTIDKSSNKNDDGHSPAIANDDEHCLIVEDDEHCSAVENDGEHCPAVGGSW